MATQNLVGEKGFVTGVDMTDNPVDVARKYVDEYYAQTLGYKENNMKFVKGEIENVKQAGIENGTIDLAISNCVVNLSPDKKAVLQGVYDALADGGEFYFSDDRIAIDGGPELRKDPILLGECLGGAMYVEDFKRLCVSVGFTDPRVLEGHVIEVKDEKLQELLGEATFYSITYRLFKDYPQGVRNVVRGLPRQYAVHKGTIEGNGQRIRYGRSSRVGNRETDVGVREHRVDVRRNVVGETLRRGW